MVAIPEHGRLEETPFPRLLVDLHHGRFSGALTLARDRVGKRFLFQDGVPVFAESNLASESLGVQLMDAGRLSRTDYTRVVAYVERERCKEGKALLELELLDARGLFVALKEQVRLRLLECFAWTRGDFHVDPSAAPAAEAQALSADLVAVLQQGIETHWSGDRILADLAPSMRRYARPGRRFAEVAGRLLRDDGVEQLIAALDGQRTLWRAAQAARSPRGLAAAWVLHALGALVLSDAPAGSDAAEVEIVVGNAPADAPRAAPAPPRPAERPAAPVRDVAALRAEIDARFDALDSLDHYALLGVARDADAARLKQAYHRAAKTYHPDTLARGGLDAETRARASRVFAEIGKAHAVLADPAGRSAYDAALAGDGGPLDADRLASAETNFRKGEILLRQGNFRASVDYLRAAVELWPDEAEYRSALGWALFKKTPSEPDAARAHLEQAVALDAKNAIAQQRLAAVLRELGAAA